MTTESARTITAGSIFTIVLTATAALLALLNTLGAVMYAHPSAILFVIAFVSVVSPLREFVWHGLGVSFSRGAVILVYLITTVAGNLWLLSG